METRKYILALVLLAGVPLLAQPAGSHAPSIIQHKVQRPGEAPLWVSAAAAIDTDTVLKWDLLGDVLRKTVERQRAALEKRGALRPGEGPGNLEVKSLQGQPCMANVLQKDHLGAHFNSSFQNLLTYSQAAYAGIVRGVEPGFFYGVPASLLQVEVTDALRGEGASASGDLVNVAHPSAHFTIGAFQFCGSSPGFEPKPGDRILLFDYSGPRGKDASLITPDDEEMFFETAAGELFLPRPMAGDPDLASVTSLAQIADLIRASHPSRPESIDERIRH